MDKVPLWIVIATTALLSMVLYVGYSSLDSIMSPVFYAPVLPLLLFVMLKLMNPEGVFGRLGTVVTVDGAIGASLHPPERLGGGEARMRCIMDSSYARRAKRSSIPPSMAGMFSFLIGHRQVTLIGLESEFIAVRHPACEPVWYFARKVDNSIPSDEERLDAELLRKVRHQEYIIQTVATEAASYKASHANSLNEREDRFLGKIYELMRPLTEMSKAASYGRQQMPQQQQREAEQ